MKRSWILVSAAILAVVGIAVWQYTRATQKAAAGSGLSPGAAASMEQKLAQIVEQAARPRGSSQTIYLSEDEINSYFLYRMGHKIPAGVYDVRLALRPDRPSGTATIDFEEVKASSKKRVNFLVDQLLTGRKPVSVAGRFTSANGTGVFVLEEVAVGSLTLRGALLDLVVRHLVLPRYPNVVLDRPFTLPANIEQIAVEEDRARVVQR